MKKLFMFALLLPVEFACGMSRAAQVTQTMAPAVVARAISLMDDKSGEAEYQEGITCFMQNKAKASPKNKEQQAAVAYFTAAMEQGNIPAIGCLGYCYELGFGVKKDLVKSIKHYWDGAQADDVFSMSHLALCLVRGKGIEKDEKEAVYWFKKAADAGDVVAKYHYGSYLLSGIGPREEGKDEKAAVCVLTQAAQAGDAYAMALLGYCYTEGRGVKKDVIAALAWFKRAQAAGYEFSTPSIAIPKDRRS